MQQFGQEIPVSRWGYEGSVHANGRIASMTTSRKATRMPDAAELRRFADFLLALAEAADGRHVILMPQDMGPITGRFRCVGEVN